jgi:hypothetical protein
VTTTLCLKTLPETEARVQTSVDLLSISLEFDQLELLLADCSISERHEPESGVKCQSRFISRPCGNRYCLGSGCGQYR